MPLYNISSIFHECIDILRENPKANISQHLSVLTLEDSLMICQITDILNKAALYQAAKSKNQ